MIGWLNGKVIDKSQPGKLVLNVNGVGYDVETSLNTFFQLELGPSEISVHIHTVVREDAFILYGFIDKKERALFRALLKISGVGPKVALAVLSRLTPDELIQCIYQQNTQALTQSPGVGKKTAERIVLEMKDSLSALIAALPHDATAVVSKVKIRSDNDEAVKALEALGYKPQEAQKMIAKVDDGQHSCEMLIRLALKATF